MIGWLMSTISGDVAAWIAAVLGIVGTFLFIRGDAKRDAKRQAKLKAARDADKTRKGVKDAVEKDDDARRAGESYADRLRRLGL